MAHGYQGQASAYVTCDEGMDTECTYRLEAAMWVDEQGTLLEDEIVHDWATSEYISAPFFELPPGHAEMIEAGWDDVQLESY